MQSVRGEGTRCAHADEYAPALTDAMDRIRDKGVLEQLLLVADVRGLPAALIGGWRIQSMTKILLVEDNEMNRDMLSRRLQKNGYEVVLAIDGEEGMAKAHSELPALILMDMSLPGIDGWEATRRLKAAPQSQKIPVIALTAHAMTDDRDKALAAGCDDFDTKPVELSRLLSKIQALLGRHAAS